VDGLRDILHLCHGRRSFLEPIVRDEWMVGWYSLRRTDEYLASSVFKLVSTTSAAVAKRRAIERTSIKRHRISYQKKAKVRASSAESENVPITTSHYRSHMVNNVSECTTNSNKSYKPPRQTLHNRRIKGSEPQNFLTRIRLI
jgi:hypothetical protein